MRMRLVSPSYLTLGQLDHLLTGASCQCIGLLDRQWQFDPAVTSIEVDFTSLVYADLRALARLVIVVTTALQDGGRVKITPPRNSDAAQFVRYSRFLEAIAETPGATIVVSSEESPRPSSNRYRNVMPLTWVQTDSELDNFLKAVLSTTAESEHRIATDDVLALSEVVLTELVENVELHSRSSGALIAAWVQTAPQDPFAENYLGGEKPYYDHIRRRAVSSLLLYVADRGIGVPESLATAYPNDSDERLMEIAFDRWSSSVDRSTARGTRGLYRIDRIARRYRGLVTLSSEALSCGRQYANQYSSHEFSFKRTSTLPGTHISVELPLSLYEHQAVAVPGDDVLELSYHMIRPGHHIEKDDLRDELIEVGGDRESTRLLDLGDVHLTHQECVTVLRYLAELSHPYKTVVFGIDASDIAIREACDDVNDEIVRDTESTGPNGIDAEPILVIGSSFHRSFWAGTDPETAAGLQQLCEGGFASSLDSVQDSNLGHFDEDGRWTLTLTPSNVWRACLEDFSDRVDAHTKYPARGMYVTPALAIVDRWIDISKVTHTAEPALGLMARLITSALESKHPNLTTSHPSLIYESTIGDQLGRAIATQLQPDRPTSNYYQRVRPRDIQVGRRLSLEYARPVVIVVGALASGDTARQLIALATRQGYRVSGVVALIDMRAGPEVDIKIWGRSYYSTSLLKLTPRATSADSPRRTFLNGMGEREPVPDNPAFPITTSRSVQILEKVDAIHLGHFAGKIDRHFTFYIDAVCALSDSDCQQELLSPMIEKIEDWISTKRRFPTLRFPPSELHQDSPARHIAHSLSETLAKTKIGKLNPSNTIENTLRDRDVIHIDWGSVSGESVLSTLRSYQSRNAKSVLYLGLFSQLPEHLESHFTSLSAYTDSDGRTMEVKVWFGAKLPVAAYPQEQCPICYQLASRGDWIGQHFGHGLILEEERLAVRSWTTSFALGTADAVAVRYSNSERPLVHNASALLRRSELVDSQSSLRLAFRYKNTLRKILEDRESFVGLITLLIYEPQWLRITPLSQERLRRAVGDKCLDTLRIPTLADRDIRAKCIIAYRLLSKNDFSRRFSEIFEYVSGDDELEALAIYMCATILTRDYLYHTGLPNVLCEEIAAIIDARRGPWDQTRRDLQAAYQRAVVLRNQASQRQPLWEQLSLLRQSINSEMPLHSVIQINPRIVRRSIPRARRNWVRIQRWMQVKVTPFVTSLADYLQTTPYLAASDDFDHFFSGKSDPIAHIIESLDRVEHGRDADLDEALQNFIENTYSSLMTLFRYGEGGSRGLLPAAVDECSIKFENICRSFEQACLEQSVDFTSNADTFGSLSILISSGYLEQLASQIADNAASYRSAQTPVVDVRLELDSQYKLPHHDVVIVVTTFNTIKVARDPDRPGPGGLTELDLHAPTGIRVIPRKHHISYSDHVVRIHLQLAQKRIQHDEF